MAFPILIAVIPVIKVAATAAAAAIAGAAGQRAGETLFDRRRGQSPPSATPSTTQVDAAIAEAQEQAAAAMERAKTAEQALCQERAMRRTLARVALPGATLAALAAGTLIGWLLAP